MLGLEILMDKGKPSSLPERRAQLGSPLLEWKLFAVAANRRAVLCLLIPITAVRVLWSYSVCIATVFVIWIW